MVSNLLNAYLGSDSSMNVETAVQARTEFRMVLIATSQVVAIAVIVSTLISLLFQWILGLPPSTLNGKTITWPELMAVVLVAPAIETFILVALIELLRRASLSKPTVILTVGLIFAILHSFTSFLAIFTSLLSFMIFARCYLEGANTHRIRGFLLAFLPHSFGNGAMFALAAITAMV